MLIVVCGLKGSGKSVALEILSERKYSTFNLDKWIREIYNYNEAGYNIIKSKLGAEFVNDKQVDRRSLVKWILEAYSPESSENQNLTKLNTIMIPLIRQKLLSLIDCNRLIFVEMAIFINHHFVFRDLCDDVVYIKRDKIPSPNPGSASWYLKKEIHPGWNVVDNNSDIETFTANLVKTVDKILDKHARKRLHITANIGN